MRAWVLARLSGFCGRCGGRFDAGARVLELSGEGWRCLRCVTCGQDYGTAEDRTQPPPGPLVSGFTRLADVMPAELAKPRLLVFDAKQKAAGDTD